MTSHYDLHFAESTHSYKFFELPPELLAIVEDTSQQPKLTIKGNAEEDAVLCTADKTFAVRSVVLSNLVLVVTRSEDDEEQKLVIRDQVQEIIELAPCVPKLAKLTQLTRGIEYDEGWDQMDTSPTQRLTYDDARAQIQASDAELDQALIERQILLVNGFLYPIAKSYLNGILEQLLNGLVVLQLDYKAADTKELFANISAEHDIPVSILTQVVAWFGIYTNGMWSMDEKKVVMQIGLGILRLHKDHPIKVKDLLKVWQQSVGDTFAASVDLLLLQGNYLSALSHKFTPPEETVVFFPASQLPVDPASRFGELFLVRQRWRSDDIAPYLKDIAIGNKDRDKLLLKYARAVTDTTDGKVYYTARAQYK